MRDILDESGDFEDVITILVDKSLITLSDNKLQMHDLLQEMGWEIARGQFAQECGSYSRLWILDDICHVLKSNTVSVNNLSIYDTHFTIYKNPQLPKVD